MTSSRITVKYHEAEVAIAWVRHDDGAHEERLWITPDGQLSCPITGPHKVSPRLAARLAEARNQVRPTRTVLDGPTLTGSQIPDDQRHLDWECLGWNDAQAVYRRVAEHLPEIAVDLDLAPGETVRRGIEWDHRLIAGQQTMTARQAADALGVSISTVYRRIRSGLITAAKVAGRWAVTGPVAA